ncbi:O-antigen ligase family protein [Bacillus sp. ISL-37]|uniref:O-antigen ligase family protein n=1 Tax=Bacillus sp. ISL-37 TaxID=2819123 RepID=UPI001BE630D7|nr:O-antigen ligase family protein [Bacillus sp. ISL-37]MBT2685473.1 O-antigen ligase family protein [Bacillus sp. ISL-37]
MSILTILFAIAGLALAFFKPKWGIFSIILFYTIRPFVSEFIPEVKVFSDGILLGGLLYVLVAYRKRLKDLFKFHLFEYAFFTFLLIGSVSALITGVSPVAIIFQLRAFLLGYLVYFIAKRIDFTRQDFKTFLFILFWWAIVFTIHGFIEKLSLRQLLLPENWRLMELSETNKIRIYGILGNPNVLGLFMMIVFFLTYFYREYLKNIPAKMIWVGLVLFETIFILTFSRGATIGIIVFLIIYIAYKRDFSFVKNMLILTAASLILSFAVVQATDLIDYPVTEESDESKKERNKKNNEAVSRFKDAFSDENVNMSSQDGRVFYILKGFEIFKEHPIIGTGFATYGDSATQTFSSPIYKHYGIENSIFYSDNQYIQIIVGTGALGVITFAVFLLSLTYFVWKKRKETPLFPLLFFFLAGFYVHGFYYNIWENYVYVLFFYFILALHEIWVKDKQYS